MEKILVIEDTDSLREVLCTVLNGEGYETAAAASAEEALDRLKSDEFSMVLSDLKLPGKSGLDFIHDSKDITTRVPIVVMTAYGSIDIAVEAMKLGAVDFITKPFDPSALVNVVSQVIEHRRIIDRSLCGGKRRKRRIMTHSESMELVLTQARKVAALSSSVLILGESGTGKELLARYIHEQSPRADEAMLAINCGSMPSTLLESEFFGHEAGAFTGASEDRAGLFEAASKGTIFLDEIGCMPQELQVKLLRTLQESEVKRIGSTEIKKVDTRVISATNSNIEEEIKHGNFRDDLYYRLGVVILEIPPLRDRVDDIELLANYFIKSFSAEFGNSETRLSEDGLKYLEAFSWPGNVRQLENVIERAMIFHDGTLGPKHFELEYQQSSSEQAPTLPEVAAKAVKAAEVEAITKMLLECGGNKTKAAKALGVSYKTLLNKVKDYEL